MIRSIEERQVDHNIAIEHIQAMLHELMQELLDAGVLTSAQLREVENRVSRRTGAPPATW